MPETSKPQVPYYSEARSAAGTGASPVPMLIAAAFFWVVVRVAGVTLPVALSAGAAVTAAPRAATPTAASRMFRRTGFIGVSLMRGMGIAGSFLLARQETGNF